MQEREREREKDTSKYTRLSVTFRKNGTVFPRRLSIFIAFDRYLYSDSAYNSDHRSPCEY